jgi:hypoxanthine phosphoribosyltransferase
MLTVINALGKDFVSCCHSLCNEVKKDGFVPDLAIGVLTGGGYIGREMIDGLNKINPQMLYKEIKLQRGSTKAKDKSHIHKILKRMPYPVLNLLRIIEVEVLELKSRIIKPIRYGSITLDQETKDLLKKGKKNILLIDDCIDTGMTLKIIKDELIKEFGNAITIKVAVVTTAHRHPVIKADYSLYNRILIRFPWANDTKK